MGRNQLIDRLSAQVGDRNIAIKIFTKAWNVVSGN